MGTDASGGHWVERTRSAAPVAAFDARIGERFELDSVAAVWTPRVESHWADRLRTARGAGTPTGHLRSASNPRANALVCNISISGAGMLAPAQPACPVGTTVEVSVGPGSHFEAIVRRLLPSEELGLAFYGVEFTGGSDVFQEWLHHVIDTHRARGND